MDKNQQDGKQLREKADKFIMMIGLSLMISMMISGITFKSITFPDFRGIIGGFVNIFMSPIVSIVGESNFFLIISAMAIITAIYSSLIQKYAIDQSRMIEVQERMKIFQKEMKEARATQNTYLLKKMEEQQAALMQENMSVVKDQFKPMFYILIVSIPLFMWANYYLGGHPTASIIFPFWGERVFSDTFAVFLTYWIYWWIISSLAFGQVLRKLLNIRAAGM